MKRSLLFLTLFSLGTCAVAQVPNDSCTIEIKIDKWKLVRKNGSYLVIVDSKPYCVVSNNACSFTVAPGPHIIETKSRSPLAIFKKKYKNDINAVNGKNYHFIGKEEIKLFPPRIVLRLYDYSTL